METQARDAAGPISPPGTVTIEDLRFGATKVVLQPPPTDDPNDPLNWSKTRKSVNFALVCFYSLMTFVLLDAGPVTWGPLHGQLGISQANLNNSFASGLAGLAVGGLLFIPFANKYGRRPVYLISALGQIAGAIWQAKVNSSWELIAANALCGLSGAISETIVQMTVKDLFFIHQRATMNGLYLTMVNIGAFLGPVPAGYVVVSQGWRWVWWWCVILLSINFVAFLGLFEETKYVISMPGAPVTDSKTQFETDPALSNDDKKDPALAQVGSSTESGPTTLKKSYIQRLALITKTDTPVIRHYHQPFFVLATFPAVAYAALIYGSLLAWFSVLITANSTYLLRPPYNFTPSGIGLMSIAPFIGGSLAGIGGGPLMDWWILFLAKRNRGIYEPEMRLWLAFPGVIMMPIGVLVFGLGLVDGRPWIILALGLGFFGFAINLLGDVSLTYVTDCYQDIVSDALVGVVFVRNGLAMVIVFTLTPWINSIGLANTMICVACLSFACGLSTIPMLIWGKRARVMTAARYKRMARLQPNQREL